MQEGGRIERLRLVSRQFRKQRLAQWAGGCGLEPYFTAMVFWSFAGSAGRQEYGLPAAGPIRTSLPWWFGSARPSFERSFLMAAQEGGRMKGLRLVSSQFRSNVWHNGLPAAGPIRTSGRQPIVPNVVKGRSRRAKTPWQPPAHCAKRCFLNCLETSLRPSIRPPSCTASKVPRKDGLAEPTLSLQN